MVQLYKGSQRVCGSTLLRLLQTHSTHGGPSALRVHTSHAPSPCVLAVCSPYMKSHSPHAGQLHMCEPASCHQGCKPDGCLMLATGPVVPQLSRTPFPAASCRETLPSIGDMNHADRCCCIPFPHRCRRPTPVFPGCHLQRHGSMLQCLYC